MENYYIIDFKNYDTNKDINNEDNNYIIFNNNIYDIVDNKKYIIFNNKSENFKDISYNDIINNELNFFYYLINSSKYLNELKECFKGNNNLLNQVNIDFNRSNIFFNNISIKNINHYYNYLEYKNYTSIINNECINIIHRLSTQSVIGEIFELIQNKISAYNLFLASGISKNKSLFINFNFYDNYFSFDVKKKFRIFTFNNNQDDTDVSICNILLTGNIDYQLKNIDKNFLVKISFS
jgi:hypothetical protein